MDTLKIKTEFTIGVLCYFFLHKISCGWYQASHSVFSILNIFVDFCPEEIFCFRDWDLLSDFKVHRKLIIMLNFERTI